MQKSSDTSEIQKTWKRLKEGDQSGLGELYESYVDDLYRFGYSICPDEDLVKDSIQEVFLDIWQYRENLTCPDNTKFYLFRSLSNRIKRELGKKRKEMFGELGNFNFSDLSESSFEEHIIGMENHLSEANKLNRAFEALTPKQREVIHLLFFENLPYPEVSKIMEINLRSTYTLAWKALEVLRKTLISFLFLLKIQLYLIG